MPQKAKLQTTYAVCLITNGNEMKGEIHGDVNAAHRHIETLVEGGADPDDITIIKGIRMRARVSTSIVVDAVSIE